MDDKDKSQANAEADAEEAYVLSDSEHEVLAPEDLDEEQAPGDRADGDAAAGKAPETVDSMRDQLLRAMAETENVRRRAKKDVHDAAQYSISNFARDLLSVADNMSRALAAVTPELKKENEALASIVDGVEMTARELDTVFERHRIKLVNPMGEPFDYNLHQAMFEDKESDLPDGTIVQGASGGLCDRGSPVASGYGRGCQRRQQAGGGLRTTTVMMRMVPALAARSILPRSFYNLL